MGFVVRTSKRPEKRVVNVEGLDGCTLTVREPTPRERMAQWIYATHAAPNDPIEWEAALWEYRQRVICDWSGFDDEKGGPQTFSQVWLEAARRQHPTLDNAAVKAANAAFRGVTEEEEKNSQAPSVVG